MRKIFYILMLIILLLLGCQSENGGGIKLDGFSVGLTYLNTNIETFGQKAEVREIMPIGLVNFKFK